MNRRTFIGGVAGVMAAPQAAAQAATEAVKSAMGLKSALTTAASFGTGMGGECANTVSPDKPPSDWLLGEARDAIKRLGNITLSDWELSEIKRESKILDGDLATSRSLSPCAAYAIQLQRNIDRRIDQDRKHLTQRIARLKEQLGPLAALI